jgi:transcription termination factor NusB
MKFRLIFNMEVDNDELLELVNDYQAYDTDGEADSFTELSKVPAELIFSVLYASDYIEEELRDYFSVSDIEQIVIVN